MLRSLSALCALSLALPTLVACARAPAPPPQAIPRLPPPALGLTYRVIRSGDGDGVLLSGRADVVNHAMHIHALAPHSAAEEDLEMEARMTDDGSIVIRVEYSERGADGAGLKWQPEMRVARGVPVRAEVGGSGWSRAIELTVQ
jgi:hypothetical protein